MHLVDCSGVAAIIFGGVLNCLLADRRVGETRASRLATINALRFAHYGSRPGANRLPEIHMANVVSNGWASLHGPPFKAAIVRSSAPFWSELAHRFCTSESARDVCMRGVVSKLVEVYDILYNGPMFLPEAAMGQLRAACVAVGVNHMRLRELSRRSGTFAFQITPKVHKFQHIPQIAESINPRWCQCYGEESCVGTVVAAWKGSVSGRYRASVQRTVLVKRVTALLLRFEMALLEE